MIKVEVHSTRAVIRSQEPLTVGLRGAKARFVFGPDWADLIKTAVFRQGEKTVTVADIGEEVTVPWEVLTLPGVPVQIGVYGSNSDGTVAIPTLWTKTAPVCPGADPEGDPSAEPTPGLWEQMQGKLGSLEQLETNEKSSLVAAVNEANRPVYLVTVFDAGDGTYTSDCGVEAIRAKMDANVPVACYWYDKEIVLPLTGFHSSDIVIFSAVRDTVEYQVVFNESSVSCYVTALAENARIPTKTSDLENDSGYLTSAPVTSVNGQTGDVTVPTPVKVTVERNEDGSYSVNLNSVKIVAAHGTGSTVYCRHGQLVLPMVYTSLARCIFSGVYDGRLHTVSVGSSDVEVSETPLASGTVKTVNGVAPDENGNVEINAGSSDGLSDNVKALLLSLFENAAYINPDMGNTLEQLRSIWLGGAVETFSVTNNLTNVTNSNTAISVTSGASYRAALTPSIDGGIITNVTVTMGGIDISDNYKDGVLNIPAVTGDIVITASAVWLYWDYTQGDIVGHGFYKNESPADATYSLEDDGLLIVNNSETQNLAFLSHNTFNCSDVEITYVVKPVEILECRSGNGKVNMWGGIVLLSTPYVALSTHHALAVNGEEIGDYVLPAPNAEYTIKIRGGVVYVNGAEVGTIEATEPSRVMIGCNGTMYIKSVSVTPLSEG